MRDTYFCLCRVAVTIRYHFKDCKFLIVIIVMVRFCVLLLVLLSTVQMTTAFTKLPVTAALSITRGSRIPSAVVNNMASVETDVAPASGAIPALLNFAGKFTSSTLYSGIETFIVVCLLAAVDCGFSGDWSRFGYVTTDVEDQVRAAVTSVGLFHFFCAAIAATSTSKKGQPVVPAVLHTLAIGGLGLFRVLLQTDDTLVRFPNVKQGFANLVAGKYDVEAVSQSIDDVLDQNTVVMYSFTTCPFCIKAKALLSEANIDFKGGLNYCSLTSCATSLLFDSYLFLMAYSLRSHHSGGA